VGRLKTLLLSDANEPFDRLVRAWLESRSRRPIRWQIIDLCYGIAAIVVVWLLLGRIAGVILGAIWIGLTALGLLPRLASCLGRRGRGGSGQ
jgi:hypothetical protein